MDRRIDERYETHLSVTVTDMLAQERVAVGEIIDISTSGVCAKLSLEFAPGAIVKVDVGDSSLFGHVMYCEGDRTFRTGIEVLHVLIGESNLARLVNAILAQNLPNTPGVTVV
jgi:PilZ domain